MKQQLTQSLPIPASLLLLMGLTLTARGAAVPPAPVPTTAAPAPAAAPVTLRYKFTAGQVLRYKMTVDSNGTVALPTGTSIPIKQHMEMIMRQTVQSLNADGAATVATALESVTGVVNGHALPPQATQAMQRNLGTITLTPVGKVLSFQPPAALAGATPGLDMSTLAQTGTAFPEGPIKIGDSWKGAVTTAMAGMQMQTASTLSGVDTSGGQDIAAIAQTITGTFHMTPPGPAAQPGDPPAPTTTVTGTLTGGGTLKFDVAAGTLVGQTNTSEMRMTLATRRPPAAGTPPPPTTTTMRFHVATHMERLPDQP